MRPQDVDPLDVTTDPRYVTTDFHYRGLRRAYLEGALTV